MRLKTALFCTCLALAPLAAAAQSGEVTPGVTVYSLDDAAPASGLPAGAQRIASFDDMVPMAIADGQGQGSNAVYADSQVPAQLNNYVAPPAAAAPQPVYQPVYQAMAVQPLAAPMQQAQYQQPQYQQPRPQMQPVYQAPADTMAYQPNPQTSIGQRSQPVVMDNPAPAAPAQVGYARPIVDDMTGGAPAPVSDPIGRMASAAPAQAAAPVQKPVEKPTPAPTQDVAEISVPLKEDVAAPVDRVCSRSNSQGSAANDPAYTSSVAQKLALLEGEKEKLRQKLEAMAPGDFRPISQCVGETRKISELEAQVSFLQDQNAALKKAQDEAIKAAAEAEAAAANAASAGSDASLLAGADVSPKEATPPPPPSVESLPKEAVTPANTAPEASPASATDTGTSSNASGTQAGSPPANQGDASAKPQS